MAQPKFYNPNGSNLTGIDYGINTNYYNPFGTQIANPIQAQVNSVDGAPYNTATQQPVTTDQSQNDSMFGAFGTIGNNGLGVTKSSTYTPQTNLNMPANFNGTQEQWDTMTPDAQQKMTLGLMGQKSGWEQAGSTMSGIGSLAGGIAGLYGAYQNAEYQKRQEGMQNRLLAADNANKSAFAKAAGGTYVPA
jgi:hypothetical protein